MNTRKLRWLSHGDIVVNLDGVNSFYQAEDDVIVNFSNHTVTVLKKITIDDIRHYLKYGKPKKRR